MSQILFKGGPIETSGVLPSIGSKAKDFQLVAKDLSTKTLADYAGNKLVLNIFPSIDTGTCATSVRKFNELAAGNDVHVLCISRDLPFAQNRFCGAEGIANVATLSDFKAGQFGKDYGLEMLSGPLAGLHSRCVIVLNEQHEVIYTEQVADIVDEPNYELALAAL
jgi:thiol peroxidase